MRKEYLSRGQPAKKVREKGVPQSQTAALPRPQEGEETDKSKQAQTAQTYEKHSSHVGKPLKSVQAKHERLKPKYGSAHVHLKSEIGKP